MTQTKCGQILAYRYQTSVRLVDQDQLLKCGLARVKGFVVVVVVVVVTLFYID